MTQLSSGAYVRKTGNEDLSILQTAGIYVRGISGEVWELLETPHTVTSLQRAAGRTPADRDRIEMIVRRLLNADLIELSADS